MAHASLWIRARDRVNAVVWNLPLPRRVIVRLSGWVYRSPPMPADRVLETLDALVHADIEAWCMGGWGVDALVGEQSRTHHDLDLIVDHADREAALAALRGLGYADWYFSSGPAGSWYRSAPDEDEKWEEIVVMRDEALRAVDLHFLSLTRSGLNASTGAIGGRPVQCLSAESQALAFENFRMRHGREHRDAALVRRVSPADAPRR